MEFDNTSHLKYDWIKTSKTLIYNNEENRQWRASLLSYLRKSYFSEYVDASRECLADRDDPPLIRKYIEKTAVGPKWKNDIFSA